LQAFPSDVVRGPQDQLLDVRADVASIGVIEDSEAVLEKIRVVVELAHDGLMHRAAVLALLGMVSTHRLQHSSRPRW